MDVEVPCCMWGTTEGEVNFDARVTNSKSPTCREPTGRRLHLRFRGRLFCAFLYHLNPFHLSKVLCHGNCRNMSEFTPWSVRLPTSVRGGFPPERFLNDVVILWWFSLWRQMASLCFSQSFFVTQHHGLTHFEGFSGACCHQPDSKNRLALDFKPSRCCKTLQLCWDIRGISDFEVRVEINALHIPSSVLTFMCLDSLQHKSWWQLMRLQGSPLRQWVMQLDTKVASTTLELPKLRHSADAAGGRAGNADWN